MTLIIIVIVLGVVSVASLIANVLLYKAGERQLDRADQYEQLYREFVTSTKEQTLQTYLQMKQLDDKQMFSKDDDVGSAFREILDLLQKLNEVTQEEEGE